MQRPQRRRSSSGLAFLAQAPVGAADRESRFRSHVNVCAVKEVGEENTNGQTAVE